MRGRRLPLHRLESGSGAFFQQAAGEITFGSMRCYTATWIEWGSGSGDRLRNTRDIERSLQIGGSETCSAPISLGCALQQLVSRAPESSR